MRRSRPVRIGELWSGFVDENPLRMRRMCEARIPEVWRETVGDAVCTLTSSLNIRNGMLYVKITSSVARHDIFLRRTAIQNELNRRLGMNVISGIIVK